ncbi:hypothetical protein [Zooshikella ganghwensis]|uniref:hypothetical protein n=1 Tax=Zooshikella ganghwensis TaxID=202772 RepID=UPI000400C327|nr:hypothetical protein [Zooshikella ganghwensis]
MTSVCFTETMSGQLSWQPNIAAQHPELKDIDAFKIADQVTHQMVLKDISIEVKIPNKKQLTASQYQKGLPGKITAGQLWLNPLFNKATQALTTRHQLTILSGRFTLFRHINANTKHMQYVLIATNANHSRFFLVHGFKKVSNAGFSWLKPWRIWQDTTTLFTSLYALTPDVTQHKQISLDKVRDILAYNQPSAYGVIYIYPWRFIQQLISFSIKATHPLRTLKHFLVFFIRSLTQVYFSKQHSKNG